MISAKDFYGRVIKAHELLYKTQMKACENAIDDMFSHMPYKFLSKGEVSLMLEQEPLPEVIEELKRLGYSDVTFKAGHSYTEEPFTLHFKVPQLAVVESSSSDKNTL